MTVQSDPTRRTFLLRTGTAGLLGGALLTAGGVLDPTGRGPRPATPFSPVARTSTTSIALTAAPATIDLGSRTVETWSYGDRLPGPEIRTVAGGTLVAGLRNDLPAETTIHWHGIRLGYKMDGAPGLSQPPVEPGSSFEYTFTTPDPGTYFYHSHVGTQLDRGVYGALIVEDPREPLGYDAEFTVLFDDWIDGTGTDPDKVFERLHADPRPSADMYSKLLGGPAGHVAYPHFLVNGRTAEAPATFEAKAGQKVRLRLVNCAADTAFKVALGGHRMTVTHSDGFPVEPVTVDTVLLGMGERYDVLVTLDSGVFPLVGVPEGRSGKALTLIRTGGGTAPDASVTVPELDRRLLAIDDLKATEAVDFGEAPGRTIDLKLRKGLHGTAWSLDTPGADDTVPLRIRVEHGERVVLSMSNATAMWHPVHLHGHTFQVLNRKGRGPRKDTVIVRPYEKVEVLFEADNEGEWMIHCHNLYHSELGMMATLGYGEPSGQPMTHTSAAKAR